MRCFQQRINKQTKILGQREDYAIEKQKEETATEEVGTPKYT